MLLNSKQLSMAKQLGFKTVVKTISAAFLRILVIFFHSIKFNSLFSMLMTQVNFNNKYIFPL